MNNVASFFAGQVPSLPPNIAQAIAIWPSISGDIHELLDTGPDLALMHPLRVVADAALRAVSLDGFPLESASSVRQRAETVIASGGAGENAAVMTALRECRSVLTKVDGFVEVLQSPHAEIPPEEIAERARQFLEDCGDLDRKLSAIPERLRRAAESRFPC